MKIVILVLIFCCFEALAYTESDLTPPGYKLVLEKSCGLQGSLLEREENCSRFSNSQRGNFVLLKKSSFKDVSWGHGETLEYEIIMDKKTGLLWSEPMPRSMTFSAALKICASEAIESQVRAHLPGVSWRQPNREELKQAAENGIDDSLQYGLQSYASGRYWTSTWVKREEPEYPENFVEVATYQPYYKRFSMERAGHEVHSVICVSQQ